MEAAAASAAAVARGLGPARVIVTSDALRSLREPWQALFERCGDATPFLSWEWQFSWWQAYGDARALRVVTWYDGDRLLAVAPLYLERQRLAPGVGCSVLRFVGDGSFDSDHLGLLVEPALRPAVVEAFLAWVRGQRAVHALVLRELPAQSWLAQALPVAARRRGLIVHEARSAAAFLDLPATLDEFLRARQSRFRTRLRALLRRVDDGELAFEADADARTLRARLRSLFALHQRRWHAAGGPGVFGTRAKRMFYAHFAPRFARRGWLRLYSLRDASGYRAHQLCFGRNGITYLLQEGFDADDTSASFGQALRAAVVRDLIDRGERGYDFLGGFSRHKADWGARETEVVHLVLGRRNLRGWLRVRAPQWREALAPRIKRALPPALVERLRRGRGRGPA